MRKRLLGSIAALAAGAGAAWGQPPVEPGTPSLPPALTAPLGPVAPQPPIGGPPIFGGIPPTAIPGNAGFAPPATIMPPGNFGPSYDPLGLGPVSGFGPPPSPMYPMPGPPGAQAWQPAPNMPNIPNGDLGYGTAPRWWFEGEYLLWFTNGQPTRYPLLTTSAPSDGGVPGAPSTTVLVGGTRDLGYNAINGLRLTAGFFGDADRRFGFQMSGFILERRANTQVFGDSGDLTQSGIPVLARPFIDATTGLNSAVVLSGPDFGAARVNVATTSQTWSVEPVAIWNLYRSAPCSPVVCSLDFMAGYKFYYIKEELFVNSRTVVDPLTALPVFQFNPFGIVTQLPATLGSAQVNFGGVTLGGPAALIIRDNFRTINKFNGGIVGLRGEVRYGMVTLDSFAKVSIGNMHERVETFGGGSFFDPIGRSGISAGTPNSPSVNTAFNLRIGGGAGSAVGGVLANSNNLGIFVHDRFSVIPEVGGNVGIAVTRGMTAFMGVTAIYFPDIARPGDQINPVVSSSAIPFSPNYGLPGATTPQYTRIRETHQWLGGVNFGVRFRY